MIKDILEEKKCFKLVCGGGNQDASEIEKLVALYSKAGCKLFDMSADVEVVSAAQRGLDYSIPKNEQKDYMICVSVAISGDPHISKAEIDFEKCIKCGHCEEVCNQKATLTDKTRCIGCGKCVKTCPQKCITLKSRNIDLKELMPHLIDLGITCVELHTTGDNETEIDEKWNYLNTLNLEMLSINVDRSKIGDEKILERLQRLLAKRKPFTTMIQTDGIAMSGDASTYKKTLQSVAITEHFLNKNLPAYIISSGGTNPKTRELLNLCEVYPNGVAVGTFARLLVRDFTSREDFLTNKDTFNEALKISTDFV